MVPPRYAPAAFWRLYVVRSKSEGSRDYVHKDDIIYTYLLSFPNATTWQNPGTLPTLQTLTRLATPDAVHQSQRLSSSSLHACSIDELERDSRPESRPRKDWPRLRRRLRLSCRPGHGTAEPQRGWSSKSGSIGSGAHASALSQGARNAASSDRTFVGRESNDMLSCFVDEQAVLPSERRTQNWKRVSRYQRAHRKWIPSEEYMDASASGNETFGGLDSVGARQRRTYIWASSSRWWLVKNRASKFKLPDLSEPKEQCYVRNEFFLSSPGRSLCLDPRGLGLESAFFTWGTLKCSVVSSMLQDEGLLGANRVLRLGNRFDLRKICDNGLTIGDIMHKEGSE
ncbi:hypothetical protein EV421DRAFT_1735017 [Armillaria borealis]|uniref:Uncharacterized protein n=1 Tax=Armillaria borealis TaxID=47425 RepID=A0AA39MT20_9AGAR|nr:hypothetical protein EV421DRAFT_1735017 [Armillaria borealis]